MRVMVMVKATDESEAGVMPSEQLISDLLKFNEDRGQTPMPEKGGLTPVSVSIL